MNTLYECNDKQYNDTTPNKHHKQYEWNVYNKGSEKVLTNEINDYQVKYTNIQCTNCNPRL